MRYEFIETQKADYPVRLLCQMLEVSPSGFYAWRQRRPSLREMADERLLREIRTIYEESRQTYGSPCIHQVLRRRGFCCGRKRVARLMRQAGIRARQRRRYRCTTRPHPNRSPAPNQLDQQFEAQAPNEKWVADITYVPTDEGWLYLAGVFDLFSRRIVGWAMAERMTQALKMALAQRRPPAGLLHHSDQGSQYTSQAYQDHLTNRQIQVSMSGAGNCYDNAVMESFFATLKTELIHHTHFRTWAEARLHIFDYIERFYNRQRIHSSLGYLAPETVERNWAALLSETSSEGVLPSLHLNP